MTIQEYVKKLGIELNPYQEKLLEEYQRYKDTGIESFYFILGMRSGKTMLMEIIAKYKEIHRGYKT